MEELWKNIFACSTEEDKDQNILDVGKLSDEIIGENYQTVISQLEEAEFTAETLGIKEQLFFDSHYDFPKII